LLKAAYSDGYCGQIFEEVGDIEPIRDDADAILSFMPQSRYRNARGLPQHRYGTGPFCKFRISNRFRTTGVYAVLISNEIRYVGECTNLSKRFNDGYGNISPKNCFKYGQETNCRVNNLIYLAALADEPVSLWFSETSLGPARSYPRDRIEDTSSLKFFEPSDDLVCPAVMALLKTE